MPLRGFTDEERAKLKASRPSAAGSFVRNVGYGLLEDPFIALAFKGLSQIEGVRPEGLEELRRRSEGGTAAQVARLMGEWGPTLLFGFGAFSGSAKLGVKAIQAIAKQTATKVAAREALEAAAGKAAEKTFLGGQLARVEARRLTDLAGVGEKALIQGTPGLQRTAESLAGNLGVSGFVASQEIARGKTPGEALRTAAITMALGGGIDLGLAGGARLLFPKARSVLMSEHRANFYKKNEKTGKSPFDFLSDLRQNITSRIQAINTELRKVLGTDAYMYELEAIPGAGRLKLGVGKKGIPEKLTPPPIPPKPPSMKKILAAKLEEHADELGKMTPEEAAQFTETLKGQAHREAVAAAEAIAPERTRISAMHKEARRIDKMLRDRRASRSEGRKIQEAIDSEGTIPYIGDGPVYGFRPMTKIWDAVDPSGQLRLSLTTAAESLFGSFGSTGNRIFTMMQRALDRADRTAVLYSETYSLWSDTARKALGETNRKWKNGVGRNLDSAHAWETGGEAGLRQYAESLGRSPQDIERLVGVFKQRKMFEWNLFQVKGREIGGKGPIDFQKQGVVEYLPHASLDLSDRALVRHLTTPTAKGGAGLSEQEARNIIRDRASHFDPDPVEFGGRGSGSPSRTGPLDFDRRGKGSLRDKILGFKDADGVQQGGGMPLNPNTWDSGYQTAAAAARRIELDPILGTRAFNKKGGRVIGRNIDDLTKAVEAEGYNGAKFRTVLETLSGKTYYNEAMRRTASALTSLQVAAKLPLAVLANASQLTLTTTWGGWRKSLRGLASMAVGGNRREYAKMLAIHEHMIKGIGRTVDDLGLVLTSFEKVADYTLRFSFFNNVERFNRLHGAATAQSVIRDTLMKAAAGRLRGNHLDRGRRTLGELGLDLNKLTLSLKKVGPKSFFENPQYLSLEEIAVMRGAQKTQFFPGKTRTPSYWSSPLGRVGLQFKTFAVGQSRFFRDAVLTEWSHGNRAPLATLLSFAPLAGEAVGDLRAVINDTERGDEGLSRYLHNISYVGGVGLITDILVQAHYGRLSSFFWGPTFSDLIDVGEAIGGLDADAIVNLAARQPLYRMGTFLMGRGMAGIETFEDYLDAQDDYDSDGPRMEAYDLRIQRAKEKR